MYLQSCSLRLKLPFLLFYGADELCIREQKIRRRSIISRNCFKVSRFMEDMNLCLCEKLPRKIFKLKKIFWENIFESFRLKNVLISFFRKKKSQ